MCKSHVHKHRVPCISKATVVVELPQSSYNTQVYFAIVLVIVLRGYRYTYIYSINSRKRKPDVVEINCQFFN